MTEDDIRDPRVVPRWLEAGITGVPRARDWDVVRVVELPELASAELGELAFEDLGGGPVATGGGDRGPPGAVLRRLAEAVGQQLDPPYEAIAVRRGRLDWALAARARELEELDLPTLDGLRALSVAISPDGERSVYTDGEAIDDDAVRCAAEELERRGRQRFAAFVASAERTASGWKLTIDPL